MPQLARHEDVYVLRLGDDENRFTLNWIDQIHVHLDDVIRDPAPLVTTADGKFYSNGLDLDWVLSNPDQHESYVARIHDLLARVLTLPVPTVAAISGHAFGGGAMLAMAHDWRVMRNDRGYLCFPEIDIKVPFTAGMAALIQAKVSPQTATVAMTTGRRFDADAATTAGVIDEASDQNDLLPNAISRLRPLAGKDTATLGSIKKTMYATVLGQLRTTAEEANGS